MKLVKETFPKRTNNRLAELDGLRGIAILLVVFTHIDNGHIVKLFPAAIQSILSAFIANGFAGVSFLFILCGFLMAYLYPDPPDKIAFLQKRYTRIFPLFLTLVLVRFVTLLDNGLDWRYRLLALAILPLLSHFVWVYIIKRIGSPRLSRVIFIVFLVFQALVIGVYVFWIMRRPALYLQTMPFNGGKIFGALVNAALALPFGNYVPMLDGVYWTLTTEVLFYVLYPFLFVPLIKYCRNQSTVLKTLLLLSVFPLLAGTDILSRRILGMAIIQFPMFIFFVGGMILAYIYKNRPAFFDDANKLFLKNRILYYLPLAISIVLLWLAQYSLRIVTAPYYQLLRMLWAVPLMLMVAAGLASSNSIGNFLRIKGLVFLGSISYSIYLCHTEAVEIAKTLIYPRGIISNVFFMLLAFALVFLAALLLNRLLEKPYFAKSGYPVMPREKTPSFGLPAGLPAYGIIAVYLIAVVISFQSKFNFFSYEHRYTSEVLRYPAASSAVNFVSMREYPRINLIFRADEDNLGIVTADLAYRKISNPRLTGDQSLIFRIREFGSGDWYYSGTYSFATISSNPDFLFGFPVISNSKGKLYEVELSLARPLTDQYLDFDISKSALKGIYQMNKREILGNPSRLAKLISLRAYNIFHDNEAQKTFLMLVPFLGWAAISTFIVVRKTSAS